MEKSNGLPPFHGLQQAYRTAYLVAGYIRETLSEEERSELDDWIVADEENMRLFGELTDENNIARSLAAFEQMQVEQDLIKVKKGLSFRHRPKVNRAWQYAIAASVIISAGVFFLYTTQSKVNNEKTVSIVQSTDIMPGATTAHLTLEDGKVIVLGDILQDSIINGNVKVSGGEVIYEGTGVTSSTMVYHTLTIPRKGKFKVLLPDGSKVWLNAESSIRYPVAFSDTERRVFVTGESYFEVAKDKAKPFRVVAGDMTVEALGTQFNINAYPNEPFFTTTLAEGSVLVSNPFNENILKPGQQAQVKDKAFTIIKVNPREVNGWINDEFVFVNTPLDAIMRQVERWYDAEVIYENKIAVHLNARIERGVPVSKLLKFLEATGHVHFKVEGKKIKVTE